MYFDLERFFVHINVVVTFEVVLDKLGDIRTVIQTYANPLNPSDGTVLALEESEQLVVKVAMIIVVGDESGLTASRDFTNWDRKTERIAMSIDGTDKIS